ncbi:MAG: HDOD domain-containing protein [Hahellaceae bacterium]|nr:HDOD domain-containing protein [Hahellaceae bacterium]
MTINANAFTQELDQRVHGGKLDIPMLPEVAHKVIQITNDPDSDASQLMKVIQADQALAAKIMRTANSAAYAATASIVSLQQAIARLGMNSIRNIALASSLNARMFKAPGLEGHIENIWQHSLATALWSKEIARGTRSNVETAFLCGLLGSIGVPIMLQEVVDIAKQENLMDNVELIMDITRELAPDAARIALESWKMPAIVTDAITHKMNYESATVGKELAMIISAASHFADVMCTEYPEIEDLKRIPVLAALNLYPDEVDAILMKAPAVREALEALRA